jgi:glucose-1-phosphate cytidylyltransferase
MMSSSTPVVILCGGRGLRMGVGQEMVPKPLVEIGGKPILWHVLALYARQGFDSFILCLGWEGDQIRREISALPGLRVCARPRECEPGDGEWCVTFADTGEETPTGGRVAQVASLVEGGTFCLTYADGLADIDLNALVDFHHRHGRAATMTVVRPLNPWGVVELDGEGQVTAFHEKPRLETWVNGGFFVMDPRALDAIGPDDVLERAPLESLARRGELRAYRHEGFWDCMDTYKDTLQLNDLWERGSAPWAAVAGSRTGS